MSCDLRNNILSALRAEAAGAMEKAQINIEVYLHNPVGIGEHPDVLAAIQEQLDVMSRQQERLDQLSKFDFHPSH